jgi:hypothetical protein
MSEKEYWKLINSNDSRVWSIAKHRSADMILDIVEDKIKLAEQFEQLTKETGDRYYIELAKSIIDGES